MEAQLIALYSSSPAAGKSTAALHLAKLHNFEIIKFAGPLKAMLDTCLQYMNYDNEEIRSRMLEGDLKEQTIIGYPEATPRYLMQTLGTEWGRDFIADDFWIRIATNRIRHFLDQDISVVVDDMRFINEYEALEMLGAKMVKLNRPDGDSEVSHRSEGSLEDMDFDAEIDNIGTVAQLHTMVSNLTY